MFRLFIWFCFQHLGFQERDPVRSNDSFAAFEEVLITAKEKHADFLLLAGDMFHDNKPSRRTMHCAMNLLRTHCLGDDPVFVAIENDEDNQYEYNYTDPRHIISLPVFAIHGNHDDPVREGGIGDPLSAMDMLSVTKLVNYIGKQDLVDSITIKPILMRKGDTYVALYSLGAIRDERLNRMFTQQKVKFMRPKEDDDRNKYMNIFVLHQNRDYGRGSKNCVHETMIPEWMDVVVWGNEHECKPEFETSLVGTFRIYQPGSSVSTSLCEGESMAHPKGFGMLSIRTKQFKLKPIRYTQIRPFVFADLSLADPKFHLEPTDAKIEDKIRDLLSQKMDEMIKEAKEGAAAVEAAHPGVLQFRVNRPDLVLIRLRVDHYGTSIYIFCRLLFNVAFFSIFSTLFRNLPLIVVSSFFIGYPALNQQRFGSQFVGQIANPSDALALTKKKKEVGGVRPPRSAAMAREPMEPRGEVEENRIRVEDLVANHLSSATSKPLSLLLEADMAQALDDFVSKRVTKAIDDTVEEALQNYQEQLREVQEGNLPREKIEDAVKKLKKKAEDELKRGERKIKSRESVYGDDDDGFEDEDGDEVVPAGKKGKAAAVGKGKAPAAAKAPARGKGAAASKAKAPAARGKAAPKGRAKKSKDDSEDDENDDDEEVDEDEDYGAKGRGKSAAGKGRAQASSSSSSGRKSSRSAAQQKKSYAEDEEGEGDDMDKDDDDQPKGPPPRSKGRGSSKAHKDEIEDDDDDDDDDPWNGDKGTSKKNPPHIATFDVDGDDDMDMGQPSFTGRSATSALTNTTAGGNGRQRQNAPSNKGSSSSSGAGGKRQLPMSLSSQSTGNPEKKAKTVIDCTEW